MNKLLFLAGVLLMAGCAPKKNDTSMATDNAADTASAKLQVFTLKNSNGVTATITNFGGRVISLQVPDKTGKMGDVVLGYDSVSSYLKGNPYFGAMIGRYGNRIGKATFTLDGTTYTLAANNGANALHGGPGGFHNVYWTATPGEGPNGSYLELIYNSVDGEEGYPGNLQAKVTYTLTADNALMIDYVATTDKPTVVNLTHHSFFNLSADLGKDILSHVIQINASRFTPVDAGLIPTGELRAVKGTPFDFTKPLAIGARIEQSDEQLKFGKGYDHNWVLDRKDNSLIQAAVVSEPTTGRVMEVWTTEPGLQFYSGNFLNGSDIGKGGVAHPFRSAFCLEAQHFPDSPNHPDFPTTVLRPGETYTQQTVYKFSVQK